MRTIFAAAMLVAGAVSTELHPYEMDFMRWIVEHGRSYGTVEEYGYRLTQFIRNHENILEMIADPTVTHEVGHNLFSDYDQGEYNSMLGYRHDLKETDPSRTVYLAQNGTVPDSVNWVDAGAVTPVKNQGSCGSCWAFSSTGSMEGSYFLKYGTLKSFSEEQFVQCSRSFGNMGCMGGLMDNAFKYAETTAIDLEAKYPYKGLKGVGGKCEYVAGDGEAGVKTFADVPLNSVAELVAAAAQQPVSVAVQANKPVFQSYKSGVITSDKCGTNLDHGVLVAGYGTENGVDYYLVKNSWGPTWGDNGYLKIARVDGAGICGIQSGPPSYPTDSKPSE